MAVFSPWHIPSLLVATGHTMAGIPFLWDPVNSIKMFGLPERVAVSKPAQSCFLLGNARLAALGAAVWIFYLQSNLDAIDTINSLMLYVGAVDAYVCWREGERGSAIFRATAGFLVGGWGLLGLTTRGNAWTKS